MAAAYSKREKMYDGLNKENFREFLMESNESVPDNSDVSFTLPGMAGVPAVPVAVEVITPASGPSPGKQVWTNYPKVATSGTGYVYKSYTEETGILLITNELGGASIKKLVYVKMLLLAPLIPTPD